MKIDLCISTYNACDKLQRCVDSVLRHTGTDEVNLLIVNDGSTDATAQYLHALRNRHPDIAAIDLETNHFKCRPLNIGLKRATSEFIVFLDDDTEVTPGWLDGLLRPIAQDRAVAMVGAKILFPDKRIFAADHRLPARLSMGMYETDYGQRNYVKECDALAGTCYLMRTELLETVGEYDENLKWHEDIDYCMRARLRGYKLIYNGEVTVYHHHLNRESGDPLKNHALFNDKWQGVLETFPLEDSPAADKLFARAMSEMNAKHWVTAIELFDKLEQALCAEPFWKGICLFSLKRFDEAVECLTQARRLAPSNAAIRNLLLHAYNLTGQKEKAREEAVDILKIPPYQLLQSVGR